MAPLTQSKHAYNLYTRGHIDLACSKQSRRIAGLQNEEPELCRKVPSVLGPHISSD